jgi:hypothetical protein
MHLRRFLVLRDSAVSGRWIDLLDKFIDADSPQPREQKTIDADAPRAKVMARLTIGEVQDAPSSVLSRTQGLLHPSPTNRRLGLCHSE